MIGFEDNAQDWSELTLEANKLQKQRDQLLNDKKYSEALLAHTQLVSVNFKINNWIIANSK